MDTFANQRVKFEESDAGLLMRLARTVVGPLICIVSMVCQPHAAPNTHIQSDPINPKYPIKTVVKEATTQASPKKKKALVAVFGVFSRSLRKTWPQINRMIVKPLERDYDVEIYGFNNQVDNIDTLDGQPIQKSSADTIKTNHKLVYEEVKQSVLDEYIKRDNSWLTHSWKAHTDFQRKNAIRQFYLEQHVADYIIHSNNDYDLVIALIADIYPLVHLSMDGINMTDNVVNTASFQYDWKKKATRKLTNGYYIGNKQTVAKIMSTVVTTTSSLENQNALNKYEAMLYKTVVENKLEYHLTDMLFCKLRSSGACGFLKVVLGSNQYKAMGLVQRLQFKIECFALWFSTQKSIRLTRILAYVICSIGLLVIMARKAAIWYLGSIHKKPFLRKGDDSI